MNLYKAIEDALFICAEIYSTPCFFIKSTVYCIKRNLFVLKFHSFLKKANLLKSRDAKLLAYSNKLWQQGYQRR